jgi:hypothetical protein
VADFDDQLTALFQAETDPALGQRMADGALGQIGLEDRRRGAILAAGAAAGLVAMLAIVDLSGALTAVRLAAFEMPRALLVNPFVWTSAAAAMALYGASALRRARAV